MNGNIMNYFTVALLWSAYLALHSFMISITVTGFLKRILGDRFRFYRLFFNLVAAATLVPVLMYTGRLKEPEFFTWDGYLAILKWTIFTGGILLFGAGSRHYSFLRFLGIRQIREGSAHSLMNWSGRLDSSGVLGLIRHPYYSGVILLFWSSNLDVTQLIVNIVVTVYVVIGTLLEERKLLIEFGERYQEYQNRVSMLLPWKWLKKIFGLKDGHGLVSRQSEH